MERLARYIVRCPFAISRLTYMADSAQVLYNGKTTGATKVYSALDFLAKLIVQIPTPREQMVRYFGYYSNKSRGLGKKMAASEGDTPNVLPAKKSSIRWARLIAKVYLVDPLCCPKCQGQMKIISFVEEDRIVAKILKYVGLWELPQGHSPPTQLPMTVATTGGDDDYRHPLLPEPDYDHCQLLPPEYEFEAC